MEEWVRTGPASFSFAVTKMWKVTKGSAYIIVHTMLSTWGNSMVILPPAPPWICKQCIALWHHSAIFYQDMQSITGQNVTEHLTVLWRQRTIARAVCLLWIEAPGRGTSGSLSGLWSHFCFFHNSQRNCQQGSQRGLEGSGVGGGLGAAGSLAGLNCGLDLQHVAGIVRGRGLPCIVCS